MTSQVLVVDDDEDILDLVRFKLEQQGLDVLTAMDGEAALATIRSDRPAMVMLDWMMPRMNGIEVLARIRADAVIADTYVLIMTARAQESDIRLGYETGANGYLVKPFNLRDLADRVCDVVGHDARPQPLP